ncbi:MAG: DUF4089 domain-containing protein [Hyphomicrobiaceae bacterium]
METSQKTLDALIEASAELLGIKIEPDWLPAVRLNLATTYRLAWLVDEVDLPDEAEPAPVFEA